MTSSPNHENENIPFEPCRSSPNVPPPPPPPVAQEDESASLIASNVVDEANQ